MRKVASVILMVVMLITVSKSAYAEQVNLSGLVWYYGPTVYLTHYYDRSPDSITLSMVTQGSGSNTHDGIAGTMTIAGAGYNSGSIPFRCNYGGQTDLNVPYTFSTIPNTSYSLSVTCSNVQTFNVWNYPVIYDRSFTMLTPGKQPIGMAFPTIEQSSVEITWNNNGNNTGSSYTLERRTETGSWSVIGSGTNLNHYIDTGLQAETKYYYRVRLNQLIGTALYSAESWVQTSADPAVASAKAAQSAAESSKTASESAKLSADKAAEDTNYIRNDILSVDAGVVRDTSGTVMTVARIVENQTALDGKSAAEWAKIAATNSGPVVKAQGKGGATCTTGSTFSICISSVPTTGVEYRVVCDSFDSGWVTTDTITITDLELAGAYTANCMVRNQLGIVSRATFTFFKL